MSPWQEAVCCRLPGKLRTALALPRTLPAPAAPSLPGLPPAGASGCWYGSQPDVAACRLPAGWCKDALFELTAPRLLRPDQDGHPGSKSGAWRPPPTAHLPACPLPAAYVDGVRLCAAGRWRAWKCARLAGTSSIATLWRLRARPLRPQASLRREVRSRRTVCPRALLVCMVLPACPYISGISFLHLLRCKWLEGAQGAKNSRQNQEWPKKGFFRCACRAHT